MPLSYLKVAFILHSFKLISLFTTLLIQYKHSLSQMYIYFEHRFQIYFCSTSFPQGCTPKTLCNIIQYVQLCLVKRLHSAVYILRQDRKRKPECLEAVTMHLLQHSFCAEYSAVPFYPTNANKAIL